MAERALIAYRNSPYYDRLQNVLTSLASSLPEKVTLTAEEIVGRHTVITDAVTTIGPGIWKGVQHALASSRSIEIHYQTPGYTSPVSRLVDPYHLVGHRGEWYVLGHSHHDDEVRIYAMSRIKQCVPTADVFTVPGDFAVERFIDPHLGIYVNEPRETVVIRFSGAVADMIRQRVWHPDQRIESTEDGGLLVTYPTNQLSGTLHWVSQWGPNAEILEPAKLREMATVWFTGAAERYAPRAD